MIDCVYEQAGEIWRCARCGDVRGKPVRRNCTNPAPVAEQNERYAWELPPEDRALLGDRIADLLAACGIPPCGGCDARKAWLNSAHRWIINACGGG